MAVGVVECVYDDVEEDVGIDVMDEELDDVETLVCEDVDVEEDENDETLVRLLLGVANEDPEDVAEYVSTLEDVDDPVVVREGVGV